MVSLPLVWVGGRMRKWLKHNAFIGIALFLVAHPSVGSSEQGVHSTGLKSAKQPALAFVQWQDPREGAFSLDVPVDWKVTGGLFRFHPTDVRSMVEVISPDGRIRVTIGDSSIPVFIEPLWMFPEGSSYSPGYGVQMAVRRFVPAKSFVLEYVKTRVAGDFADLAIVDWRDRSDRVQNMDPISGPPVGFGFSTTATAGEVSFTGTREGRSLLGYYFCNTKLTQAFETRLWNVESLYGYLADVTRADQAKVVLDHMLQTVRISPEWSSMQRNLAAETSRIVSETSREISRTISESYWRRQRAKDHPGRHDYDRPRRQEY
jgi:hypothetical protein